jgi:hypothetical protein
MVIRVQEDDFLSLNHEEQSVHKLQVLGQVVQIIESNELWGPCLGVTDGKEQAVVIEDWNQLFDHQHQERQRDERKHQVMELEQKVQFPCCPIVLLEQVLATEDHGIVQCDGDSDWWES